MESQEVCEATCGQRGQCFSLCVSTVDISAATSNDCECVAVTADVITPPPSHSIEPMGTSTRSMARLQDDVEQFRTEMVSYLAPEGVARYCFHPVCLSVCVCVCVCACPANNLVFYFSAIRRDIDLKFMQDIYRVVLNSLKKH